MVQIWELIESEIKNKLLVEFYDVVGAALNADVNEVLYDCRKIYISSFIQDCIYDAYRARFPEQYRDNPIQFDNAVTVQLAISGPKVSPELLPYQIQIEDGFLCDY